LRRAFMRFLPARHTATFRWRIARHRLPWRPIPLTPRTPLGFAPIRDGMAAGGRISLACRASISSGRASMPARRTVLCLVVLARRRHRPEGE